MRRRDFILLVGGAAAWPITAHAQQPDRPRRIGVLMTGLENDAGGQARIAAFLQGMQQMGWTDGRNIRDRHPLERRRQCQGAGERGGIGRPRAGRYRGYGQRKYGTVDANIRHRADRILDRS